MRDSIIATALLLLLTAACQSTPDVPCTPEHDRALGNAMCLVAHTHGVENAGEAPTLFILLHGDVSRGGPATYQIPAVKEVGDRQGVISVALIRPGYAGEGGASSQGSHTGRRNHYTEGNNRAIGEAIEVLKAHYKPSKTIVMGHSGGAAQTGAAIGLFPGLADHAYLVSCPCDIPRWRSSRGKSAWPSSQSPIDFAGSVAPSTKVTAVTGTSDNNTFPSLAEDYIAALKGHGISAEYIPVPGAGHGFDALWRAIKERLEL